MRRTIVLLATMALTLLVASGVALAVTKIGTNGPDYIVGTNGDDNLLGKGGNDILFALRGHDTLLGGPGKDVLSGGNDSDNLVGANGNDWLAAGQGKSNKAVCEEGNDVIDIANQRAFKDVVVCGSGSDRVLADRKDVVAPNCEKVSFGDAEKFYESIPQSFFEGLPPALSG